MTHSCVQWKSECRKPYIFVLKSSEDSNFSQSSLAISLVLEWTDFLDSNHLTQLSVLR